MIVLFYYFVYSVSGCSNVTVNTIDSYQGTERDVIIISNARTSGVGFLSTYQRLNVALTRPKKCLILCGNFKDLEVNIIIMKLTVKVTKLKSEVGYRHLVCVYYLFFSVIV